MPAVVGASAYSPPSAEEKERFTPVVTKYITEKLGKESNIVEIRRIRSQITNVKMYFLEVLHDEGYSQITLREDPKADGVELTVVGHEYLTFN
uniref:PepSY domain-containing protein n=1 Tax=Mesocestoides corti TaxID=53468 RepID=A0A5K3FY57_MESCO